MGMQPSMRPSRVALRSTSASWLTSPIRFALGNRLLSVQGTCSVAKQSDLNGDATFHAAVASCLALNVGKLADLANSLCPWEPVAECPRHLFSRQAVRSEWGCNLPCGRRELPCAQRRQAG